MGEKEKSISNDAKAMSEESPIAQILKAQYEYQTKSLEEYMKYLSVLQGTIGPYAPGTIMTPSPDLELEAASTPGTTVELTLKVENKQFAYSVVSPVMTPFITESGITWFPDVEFSPVSMLLAPQETKKIVIKIKLPTELSPNLFHGSLLLIGFRFGGIPVKIRVKEEETQPPAKEPTENLTQKKRANTAAESTKNEHNEEKKEGTS